MKHKKILSVLTATSILTSLALPAWVNPVGAFSTGESSTGSISVKRLSTLKEPSGKTLIKAQYDGVSQKRVLLNFKDGRVTITNQKTGATLPVRRMTVFPGKAVIEVQDVIPAGTYRVSVEGITREAEFTVGESLDKRIIDSTGNGRSSDSNQATVQNISDNAIGSVVGTEGDNKIKVTFKEAVDEGSAENKDNYSISGYEVNSAKLDLTNKKISSLILDKPLTSTSSENPTKSVLLVKNIKHKGNAQGFNAEKELTINPKLQVSKEKTSEQDMTTKIVFEKTFSKKKGERFQENFNIPPHYGWVKVCYRNDGEVDENITITQLDGYYAGSKKLSDTVSQPQKNKEYEYSESKAQWGAGNHEIVISNGNNAISGKITILCSTNPIS